MARARNIKPGFFHNEDLAECEPFARLCFAGLWTLADREGRLEDRPKRIKGELFAYDNVDVEELLVQLARHGFIARYEANGMRLLQVLKFGKHQNPHHREAASMLAAMPGYVADVLEKPKAETSSEGVETQGEPEAGPRPAQGLDPMEGGASRADSGFLIPDSPTLIPDTPVSSSARKRARNAPASLRCPADFAVSPAMRQWAREEFPGVDLELQTGMFRDHTFDKARSDWPATWRNWIRRATQYARAPTAPRHSKQEQQAATLAGLTGFHQPLPRRTDEASMHGVIDGDIRRID